jgi:outer membrane protein assembly factor BamB
MRTFLTAWLLALLALVLSCPSLAQGWQWSRHFGGPGHDFGQVGAVDAAGNVYCFGNYANSGPGTYHDLYIGQDTLEGTLAGYIAKYDEEGTMLWALNFACDNVSGRLSVTSMILDSSASTLIITGGHWSSCTIGSISLPDSGAYLANVDLDGNCFWAANIGSARTAGKGLVLNDQDELFVSGTISHFGTSYVGDQAIAPGSFLAKYSPDGTQLWAKSLTIGVGTQGYSRYTPYTLQYKGGFIYAHGPCFGSPNGEPIVADSITIPMSQGVDLLAALDANTGVAVWLRDFGLGSSGGTYGYDNRMRVSGTGAVYCIGSIYDGGSAFFSSDTTVLLPPNGLSYLVKYSPSGVLLQLHTYDRIGMGAIDVTQDGSILITGYVINEPITLDVCSGASGQGLFVTRMDSIGNCINMIATGYATGTSILQTAQGIYLTATTPPSPQFNTNTLLGESVTSYGFEDVLLAKLDLSLGVQSFSIGGNDGLNIYANPNQGSFQVQVPEAIANAPHLELKIYDAMGRLVLSQGIGTEDTHPQLDLYDVGKPPVNCIL